MAALAGLVLLFALMIVGAPIAIAMLLSGAVGLYLVGGVQLLVGIVSIAPLGSVQGYEFATVPMFILMATSSSRAASATRCSASPRCGWAACRAASPTPRR
jgi:hypothetical protein